MPKTTAKKKRRTRPTSARPKEPPVPGHSPEMEEFEEGRYPAKASGIHLEEDAGLDARTRAEAQAEELARRGPREG